MTALVTQRQSPKWQRAGEPGDLIASIMLAHFEPYAQALEPLFEDSYVPDSGIVVCNNSALADGGRIEKSCYSRGGFKFLVKPNTQSPAPETASFPTAQLTSLLEGIGDLYLRHVVDIDGKRASLDTCWAVCQREGDYGTLHNHVPPDSVGSERFSGMFYLRTPPAINPDTFPNGCLHIITSNGGVVYIPPIPGSITLWPSRLLHGIHPFRGSGDRLGIAFDLVSK